MQTLQIKTKDPDGNEIKKKVVVLRSWGNVSGHQLFLHADGTYGFKDGAPARNEQDIKRVISDKIQLGLALSWWERVGRQQSEVFYTAMEKRQRQLAGDHSQTSATADSDKDMILYAKVPTISGNAENIPTPQTWMELGFSRRPDWWGQARIVSFADWTYLRHDVDTNTDSEQKKEAPGPDLQIETGQKKLAEMSKAFLNDHIVTVRHLDDELFKQYGLLRVIKTTPKYVQAAAMGTGDTDQIIFSGDDEPHPKIPIINLLLVSVEPVAKSEEKDLGANPQTVQPGEF